MCDYQRGTFECRGDGYTWDANSDGYDPSEKDSPCPKCNTNEYLLGAKDDAETCSEGSANGYYYTGESIWLNAVRIAEAANHEAAQVALREIGIVKALLPDSTAPDGCREQAYVY